MQKYYTTSTAPGFSWTFVDQSGNALNLGGATLSLIYRCLNNFLKVAGGGSWGTPSGNQVAYTLGASDMSNAYALASSLVGKAHFEILATAVIGGKEYDALPVIIEIEKI